MKSQSHRATLIASAAALALVGCGGPPGVLGGTDTKTLSGSYARPGQLVTFGITLDPPESSKTVSLVSVSSVELQHPMEIVSIRAIRPSEYGSTLGGVLDDPAKHATGVFKPHPVSEITLLPRSVPDWQVIVTLRCSRFGKYRVKGFEFRYKVDGTDGSEFLPRAMELQVIDCKRSHPVEADFVCSGGQLLPRR
jgi:hypothetical protein